MKDIFGFALSVGDTVAFIKPTTNSLVHGKIRNIGVNHLYIKWQGGIANKYPADVVKRVLEPADLKLLKFTLGSDQ